MSYLFSSMIEYMEKATESFGDKPLEAQPLHKLGEAKPGKQEG